MIVTDYLDESAKKFPNKIAFVDEKRSITFAELRNESLKIAENLIQQNFFKKPIAIYIEKSVECVAAFMGVAYSGNFYTPLDVKMPKSRAEKIIETLQPSAIITNENLFEQANQFNVKTYIYENIQKNTLNEQIVKDVGRKIIDTDILYVMFTSGSTGTPKGVIISHKSLISYIEWGKEAFQFNDKTVFGNQTPFYFSMSVMDIYQTIRNGSALYMIPHMLFSFPIKLLEYINESKINTLYWVPSALCIVVNFKALGKIDISCVKNILFAGEVMPVKQMNIWRKNLPNARFANLFGPTEFTDICNYYIVDRNFSDDEPLPLGKSCKNTDTFILNERDELVTKENEIGELCIRGTCLAYGYYNDPERTAAAFVQNPLNKSYSEKIYRTGDLAHYNEHGELMFDGRKDFQIKHMGHRIELGEIETAALSLNDVNQCCCIYDTNKNHIVMFYSGDVDEKFLKENLKKLLPEYMLPNQKICLDELPLNANGKIDRIKLKEKLN